VSEKQWCHTLTTRTLKKRETEGDNTKFLVLFVPFFMKGETEKVMKREEVSTPMVPERWRNLSEDR